MRFNHIINTLRNSYFPETFVSMRKHSIADISRLLASHILLKLWFPYYDIADRRSESVVDSASLSLPTHIIWKQEASFRSISLFSSSLAFSWNVETVYLLWSQLPRPVMVGEQPTVVCLKKSVDHAWCPITIPLPSANLKLVLYYLIGGIQNLFKISGDKNLNKSLYDISIIAVQNCITISKHQL